jgi:glutaredoxin
MAQLVNVSLIGKPGCHLCDDARLVVNTVIAEFRAAHTGVNAAVQVKLEEENILEDTALAAKYSEEIPVLLINGKVHNYWRIDPIRLRDALENLVN